VLSSSPFVLQMPMLACVLRRMNNNTVCRTLNILSLIICDTDSRIGTCPVSLGIKTSCVCFHCDNYYWHFLQIVFPLKLMSMLLVHNTQFSYIILKFVLLPDTIIDVINIIKWWHMPLYLHFGTGPTGSNFLQVSQLNKLRK